MSQNLYRSTAHAQVQNDLLQDLLEKPRGNIEESKTTTSFLHPSFHRMAYGRRAGSSGIVTGFVSFSMPTLICLVYPCRLHINMCRSVHSIHDHDPTIKVLEM